MKKLVILFLFMSCVKLISAQEINSINAVGNLESPNPLSCVGLSGVTNQHNPVDIINGLKKCTEQKEYNHAAKLYILSMAFARYDMKRVKDETAHQAIIVLQQGIFADFSEDEKNALTQEFNLVLGEDFNSTCQFIKKIGSPNYHPTYMIQHGMDAFNKKKDKGLVKNFNSKETWNQILIDYLHCEP